MAEAPKNSTEVEAGREATKDGVDVGDLKKASPWTKENLLFVFTLIGVFSAIIIGFGLRFWFIGEPVLERTSMYVSYFGELFLRILGALILPLILPNLVVAIGSLDLRSSWKIFSISLLYYGVTTLVAVGLGTLLVSVIKPGYVTNVNAGNNTVANDTTAFINQTKDFSCIEQGDADAVYIDTFLDLGRNLFAPNVVQACLQQYRTVRTCPMEMPDNDLMGVCEIEIDPENIATWKIGKKYVDSTNMLGLMTCAIMLGIALSSLKEKAKPLMDVFVCLSEAMTKITGWIMWASPFAVSLLILGKILEVKKVGSVLYPLLYYLLTVIIGLVIHGCAVLPFLYLMFGWKNPLPFIWNMASALNVAFVTASSSAALPTTIKAIQEENNVDSRISGFVLNVGASINMDGTALYEAVAAIFIAQSQGEELDGMRVFMIAITATLASIGAAGIPQAGMMTIVMVLQTVGLPIDDVSRILAVDWLLDRFRTVVNVLGDSIGAGIVHEWCKKDLAKTDSMISMKACCDLKGHDVKVTSIVRFNQAGDGPVHVTGSINGLTPGDYCVHVHEFRKFAKFRIFDENLAGCKSTFNPNGAEQGAPTNCKKERHAGTI